MTFGEYLVEVQRQRIQHKSWRLGQAYYNVLDDIRPDLNASIVGTHGDPYYSDGNIQRYLDFVARNW